MSYLIYKFKTYFLIDNVKSAVIIEIELSYYRH